MRGEAIKKIGQIENVTNNKPNIVDELFLTNGCKCEDLPEKCRRPRTFQSTGECMR